MTPLTFGNLLKFGPKSWHNTKGRLPSSTKREREREREHSKSHTNHATHHTCAHYAIPFLRRAFNKPRTRAGELPRRVVERRPHDDGGFPPWSRPNIDSYDSQTWLECYCHHWYWCYQPYHQWYVDKTLKWHFLLTNFFSLLFRKTKKFQGGWGGIFCWVGLK